MKVLPQDGPEIILVPPRWQKDNDAEAKSAKIMIFQAQSLSLSEPLVTDTPTMHDFVSFYTYDKRQPGSEGSYDQKDVLMNMKSTKVG